MTNPSTQKHPLYATYADYLKSPAWRQKKNIYKNQLKTPKCCFACLKDGESVKYKDFDFHHTRYDNIFNEPLKDIILLCRNCHSRLSRDFIKNMKARKNELFPLPPMDLYEFTKAFIYWEHKSLNVALEKTKYILGWVK